MAAVGGEAYAQRGEHITDLVELMQRHKFHYADVRIMPTMVVKPLVVGVDGLGKSA